MILFFYSNFLAAILEMIYLTVIGLYFSLGTVIFAFYGKFPLRMRMSPYSTNDVRMDFSDYKWSMKITCGPGGNGGEDMNQNLAFLCTYIWWIISDRESSEKSRIISMAAILNFSHFPPFPDQKNILN